MQVIASNRRRGLLATLNRVQAEVRQRLRAIYTLPLPNVARQRIVARDRRLNELRYREIPRLMRAIRGARPTLRRSLTRNRRVYFRRFRR